MGKFLTQGAKSVTMDDVCGICGISKKTLYQYFSTKEALLKEMLYFVSDSIMNEVEKIQIKNHHPIEEMFIIHERIFRY